MDVPSTLFGFAFNTRQREALVRLANWIEDWIASPEVFSVTASTELTSVGGVLTINWALGNMFHIQLTQNITSVVFTNLPEDGDGQAITLLIQQGYPSSYTITGWPSEVSWFIEDYEVSTTAEMIDEIGLSIYKESSGVILGKAAKGATIGGGGGGG